MDIYKFVCFSRITQNVETIAHWACVSQRNIRLVFPNFHSCFYNSMKTRNVFFTISSVDFQTYWHMVLRILVSISEVFQNRKPQRKQNWTATQLHLFYWTESTIIKLRSFIFYSIYFFVWSFSAVIGCI
jgi:hypothetical protein